MTKKVSANRGGRLCNKGQILNNMKTKRFKNKRKLQKTVEYRVERSLQNLGSISVYNKYPKGLVRKYVRQDYYKE
jgi:ribosomal protein L15E